MTSSQPHSSGRAGDRGPQGGPIATVRAGRYVLELGSPPGALVTNQTQPASDDSQSLAKAIEGAGRPEATERVEGLIDPLEEATARAERAVELFKALAEGKVLDPAWLSSEVDLILNLIERLDSDGEWERGLRLARAASDLFALTRRWWVLIRSLRIALHAAEKLGDVSAAAWAWHQLGTVHLAAEDHYGASRALEEAQAIRESIGDRPGLAATEHNLGALCQRLRELLRETRNPHREERLGRSRHLVLAAAAVLLLVFGLGVAAGTVLGGGESSEPRIGGGGGSAGGAADSNGGGGGNGDTPEAVPAVLSGSGAFPDTTRNSSSDPQTITATNPGQVEITLGSFTIGGEHAQDFEIASNECSGETLGPGARCFVGVRFAPSTSGGRSATLRLDDAGTGSEATVPLSGTAVSPPVE